MSIYARLTHPSSIPQNRPLNERQVQNAAGGYAFAVDSFTALDRFVVTGSDAGSYYATAPALTRANAHCVVTCWEQDPLRTAARIAQMSEDGRVPRLSPAFFALALGACHFREDVRRAALAALPQTCRTASHLFEFVACATALDRGWGSGLRKAVRGWYEARDAGALALQMTKYRSRSGFSHKRLLQLAHPRAGTDAQLQALYGWACGKRDVEEALLPPMVQGHLQAMRSQTAAQLVPLVEAHGLQWEAIPTWALGDADVWRALLPSMKATALLRNLGTLTRLGVLENRAAMTLVIDRLTDRQFLRRGRVHPFAILLAHAVYGSGRAVRGSTAWFPEKRILKALDRAFYTAFKTVEPTRKRRLVAVDVSGSMDAQYVANSPLTCRHAAAAMAMVTLAVERDAHVIAFAGEPMPLPLAAGMTLGEVLKVMSGLPFGPTDCAAPMLYALKKDLPVDAFEVYTDNETWFGQTHPAAALRDYRATMGIPAKLAVVGFTANRVSIADPMDAGMMDFVGFDAAGPAVMTDFIRG